MSLRYNTLHTTQHNATHAIQYVMGCCPQEITCPEVLYEEVVEVRERLLPYLKGRTQDTEQLVISGY